MVKIKNPTFVARHHKPLVLQILHNMYNSLLNGTTKEEQVSALPQYMEIGLSQLLAEADQSKGLLGNN